jgi:hypothetical protein
LPLITMRCVPREEVDLLQQHVRIDDDAVSDHRHHAGRQDRGRDQVQLQRDAVVHDRVARVVAALIAHDVIRLRGEDVGDLAFAFVSPLGADENACGHGGGSAGTGAAPGHHEPGGVGARERRHVVRGAWLTGRV